MRSYCIALCAGVFSASPALATEDITACGFSITEPGNYELEANLNCTEGFNPIGIRVFMTEDVVIKLNGHSLRGRPNAAYGGQGTGIAVYGSSDVEIKGRSQSLIAEWASGIMVNNSSDVKVDGDGLRMKRSSQAIFARSSQEVEIDDVAFRENVQRDIHLSDVHDAEIEKTEHFGPASQGILVSGSSQVTINRVEVSKAQPMNSGIIFYQSTNSQLRRSEIDNTTYGVTLNGSATSGIKLRDNQFGENVPNTCDLRTAFGAQNADLEDNDPDVLSEC